MSAPETGQGSGYRHKMINGWRTPHGGVGLDPHAVGACVLAIDGENPRTLVEPVAEWLR